MDQQQSPKQMDISATISVDDSNAKWEDLNTFSPNAYTSVASENKKEKNEVSFNDDCGLIPSRSVNVNDEVLQEESESKSPAVDTHLKEQMQRDLFERHLAQRLLLEELKSDVGGLFGDDEGDPMKQVAQLAGLARLLSPDRRDPMQRLAGLPGAGLSDLLSDKNVGIMKNAVLPFTKSQKVQWDIDKEDLRCLYRPDMDDESLDKLHTVRGHVIEILTKRQATIVFDEVQQYLKVNLKHLKCMDPPCTERNGKPLECGCFVKVCADRDEAKREQEDFGGFNSHMAECCGKVGYVQGYGGKNVRVFCNGTSFAWNPILLERVDNEQLEAWRVKNAGRKSFNYGDLVAINESSANCHLNLSQFRSKCGYVAKVYEDDDLKVIVGSQLIRLDKKHFTMLVHNGNDEEPDLGVNSTKVDASTTDLKPTNYVETQCVLWNLELEEFQRLYEEKNLPLEKAKEILDSKGRILFIRQNGKCNVDFNHPGKLLSTPPIWLKPMDPPFPDKHGADLSVGTLVRICDDLDVVAQYHKDRSDERTQCRGKVGYVQGCNHTHVRVLSGDKSLMWSSHLLERIPQHQLDVWQSAHEGDDHLSPFDVVKFKEHDVAKIEAAQRGHGGWNKKMAPIIEKFGCVVKIYRELRQGTVKVYFGEKNFNVNSSLLSVVVPASESAPGKPRKDKMADIKNKLKNFQKLHQLLHTGGILIGEKVMWNVTAKSFQKRTKFTLPKEKVDELLESDGEIVSVHKKESKVFRFHVKFECYDSTFTVAMPVLKPKSPILYSQLQLGDLVRIENDEKQVEQVHQEAADYHPDMLKCCGKIGCVRGGDGKNVVVLSGNKLFAWNPELLTKLTEDEVAQKKAQYSSDRNFQRGDILSVINDVKEIERLQDGHGGWNKSMAAMAGKLGVVHEVNENGDPLVQVNMMIYQLNKEACTRIVGAEECAPYPTEDREAIRIPKVPKNQYDKEARRRQTHFLPKQEIKWNIDNDEFIKHYAGKMSEDKVDSLLKSFGRVVKTKSRVEVLFEGHEGSLIAAPAHCFIARDLPFVDKKGASLSVGSLVKISDNRNEIIKCQDEEYGSYNNQLGQCCGKVGYVQGFCDKSVRVICGDKSCVWNPALLEHVDYVVMDIEDNSTFLPYDWVAFKVTEKEKIQEMQGRNWKESFNVFVNKLGYVLKVYDDGDLKVMFGCTPIRLNRALCCSVRAKFPSYPYWIVKRLGVGAYGTVELVKHVKTKKQYAMKRFNKEKNPAEDKKERERNLSEFKKMKSLEKHLCLVRYVDWIKYTYEDNEGWKLKYTYFCIIMEYCSGGNLKDHIKSRNKQHLFPEAKIEEYFLQLIWGLQALHNAECVHHDIKPENILLTAYGTLKITDFGTVREYIRGSTKFASRRGTSAYWAPEIWFHNCGINSKKVDIFAAGCVLYELMELKQAFDGEEMTSYERPSLSECWSTSRLKSIYERMLRKKPEDRPVVDDILKKDFPDSFLNVKKKLEEIAAKNPDFQLD